MSICIIFQTIGKQKSLNERGKGLLPAVGSGENSLRAKM